MQRLRVGAGGDAASITQALQQTDPAQPLTLELAAQRFEERVFSEHRALRLIGQGADKTSIVWHNGAYDLHPDGKKRGTFRSYTAFFDGDYLSAEHLTIENSAGDGRTRGQSIAASVHSRHVFMHDVTLRSMQDTLFLAPLPAKERQADGFLGPRQDAPRIPTRQLYERCRIEGDVDFIFGGAQALFFHCALHGRGARQGYLAAPSGNEKEIGFFFENCEISADKSGILYLARPWRDGARAMFYHCAMGEAIAPEGFSPWQSAPGSFTFCVEPETVPFAHSSQLSKQELEHWRSRAHAMGQELREAMKRVFQT